MVGAGEFEEVMKAVFELAGAAATVLDDLNELGVPAVAVVEVAGWGVVVEVGVSVSVSIVVVGVTTGAVGGS